MQQVTLSPLADITSIMVGTTATWQWEVTAVFVNGVSKPFTWIGSGALSVPSYVSGTVLVEFGLYLLYDVPSQTFPKDPTVPSSAPIFWENRLRNFIQFSTSIKSFESGMTEIAAGTIQIQLDDDWIELSRQQLIMPSTVIRIYRDGQIVFKGIATRHTIGQDYVMSINIQKRIAVFDSECHFGDPTYLNRIDRSTNTSYYNGANVPLQFEGAVIPMLFGREFPYDQTEYSEIDVGPANPSFFPTGGPTKFGEKSVNTSAFIVQVIPTSATTGIIGRMPGYQSLVSSPSNILFNTASFPVPDQRFYKRSENVPNATITSGTICGEILLIRRDAAALISATRLWRQDKDAGNCAVFLGLEDVAYDRFNTLISFSPTEHWFSSRIPDNTWTLPAVAVGPPTPGGNRWITANFTGVNLLDNEVYVVFTGITGAKNNFDLMKWIIEKHGITVEPTSFSSLNAEFPVGTIQQVGLGNDMPTLGTVVGEMNQGLMTILVFPANNDVPFIKKIDASESPILTLNESQIDGLSVSSEYRNQAANVQFRSRYARSDRYKYDLYRNKIAPEKDLFASQKTFESSHVLSDLSTSVTDRWDEMTKIYGSPITIITFDLLDPGVDVDVGDTIYIDHDLFKNKILITNIDNKAQGRTIQGRYFYVDQD